MLRILIKYKVSLKKKKVTITEHDVCLYSLLLETYNIVFLLPGLFSANSYVFEHIMKCMHTADAFFRLPLL